MDGTVELTTSDSGTIPAREGKTIKNNLEQALRACSEMRGHQEYISIRQLWDNKVYDRVEIYHMIKRLP
jgi:hypothetical protein